MHPSDFIFPSIVLDFMPLVAFDPREKTAYKEELWAGHRAVTGVGIKEQVHLRIHYSALHSHTICGVILPANHNV